MDKSVIALVLGSSFLAALLTQGVAWLREWLTDRRSGRFSALRIVLALEDYSRQCLKQVNDVDVASRTSGEAGQFHHQLPPSPVIDDLVFDKLDVDEASAVQAIWVEASRLNVGISLHLEHHEPEMGFQLHDRYATTVGLKCLLVAEHIRKRHHLAAEPGLALLALRNSYERRREKSAGIRQDIEAVIEEAKARERLAKEPPRWLLPFISARKAVRGPFSP